VEEAIGPSTKGAGSGRRSGHHHHHHHNHHNRSRRQQRQQQQQHFESAGEQLQVRRRHADNRQNYMVLCAQFYNELQD
jgi:hypothetical protein